MPRRPTRVTEVEESEDSLPPERDHEARALARHRSRASAEAMWRDIEQGHRKQQMLVTYTQGSTAITPPCPWLTYTDSAVASLVVREAHSSLGICEEPLGSNRGPEIDEWNRKARVPTGSYWCASWAGAMWWQGGIVPPPGYASVDRLIAWARQTGRFSENVPTLGAMVFYGKWNPAELAKGRRVLLSKDDGVHVGIVARIKPQVVSYEGNTTVEGSRLERNGTAVAIKLVTPEDPVIGFAHLTPLVPQLDKAA